MRKRYQNPQEFYQYQRDFEADGWECSQPEPPAQEHPQKAELLQEAAKKPAQWFLQFDALSPGVVGGEMFAGSVLELRRGTPVRIQIERAVSRQQALVCLKNLVRWIETDAELWERLTADWQGQDFWGDPPAGDPMTEDDEGIGEAFAQGACG